uniref:C3H1-type domain-containing protein n=1 Tax=Wuchereria bancrofti TaxID=6293 RepID=A0A1I8EUX0_WUCBA
AVSLLEARIRACSPNNGVLVTSTTDAYRLEILTSAHFLSNIKIARLTNASNGRPNIQYPNTSTDIGTLEATIEIEDDSKSHKEVKIEVFTEDEDDYGVEEDDVCALNQNDNRNSWEMECNKSLNENTNMAMNHASYDGAANCDVAEYINEYPPLPNTESGSPLCYSAVVKDCSNVATPQRNTSSMTSVSTQMSQWDQMVIERGGKFNKPAPQCIHWNNPKHRLDFPCRFWHPREQCRYYPNCSNTADECGFAHPFCGDFCRCPRGKRDPQKNHRIPEEKYFGGGDRMKYTTDSDAQ